MRAPVLIVPAFLDRPACRRIRAAMDAGAPEPAEVLDNGVTLDPARRRAVHVEVDQDTLAFVGRVLDGARTKIAARFGVEPGEREGSGLLRYTSGGFYGPHRDCGALASWPDAARRRISVVLFLTSSRDADAEGTFTGGMLRLFTGTDAGAAIDVQPREGMLVAFPAAMLHEVAPVQDGTRDAIVDWFY